MWRIDEFSLHREVMLGGWFTFSAGFLAERSQKIVYLKDNSCNEFMLNLNRYLFELYEYLYQLNNICSNLIIIYVELN